jgi:heme exporter protein A
LSTFDDPGHTGLRAEGLACRRGDRLLFENLGFALQAGAWLHVRGANGAGKTSLLRLLAGLGRPEAGAVRWNGVEIARGDSATRRDIAFQGHQGGLKDELSALQNLRSAAAIDGLPLREDAALAALRRVGLRGREDLPLRVLSQGQKRRAALARLLARQARLWILDEPFNALDASGVELVGELLAAHLAGAGLAVLTSHQPIPLAAPQELSLG